LFDALPSPRPSPLIGERVSVECRLGIAVLPPCNTPEEGCGRLETWMLPAPCRPSSLSPSSHSELPSHCEAPDSSDAAAVARAVLTHTERRGRNRSSESAGADSGVNARSAQRGRAPMNRLERLSRPKGAAKPVAFQATERRSKASGRLTPARWHTLVATISPLGDNELRQCELVERQCKHAFPPCKLALRKFLLAFPTGLLAGTQFELAFPS
jgi:hypothetical protein